MGELALQPTNCTSMAGVRSHHLILVSGVDLLVGSLVQTFISLVIIVEVAAATTAIEAFAVKEEFTGGLELQELAVMFSSKSKLGPNFGFVKSLDSPPYS